MLARPGMPEAMKRYRRLDPRSLASGHERALLAAASPKCPIVAQEHVLAPRAAGADTDEKAAACWSSGTWQGLPLLAPTMCREGASGWKSWIFSRMSPPQRQPLSRAARTSRRKPGGQALRSRRAF
jgi:hypothetical protein